MFSRRRLLLSSAALALSRRAGAQTTSRPRPAFGFDEVVARAQDAAARPFEDPSSTIPNAWRELSYDQYRQIRFMPERALWRGQRLFQLQLFHPGFYFDTPVALNIIDDGSVAPLEYDPSRFEFGDLDPARLGDVGAYAGFRVHYPLHSAKIHDEFAVFLGASYFRLIGRDQDYGLSARGLAIDTAERGGEEFPLFREFWIERPDPDDNSLTLYALLDSRSVSGAYRIVLRPRTATQADVRAVLFPRVDINKLGLAPLTSMFLYGEARDRARRFDDFRPEVHDSDGLMIHAGSGEWLWRPLVNRERLQISSFSIDAPRGFGLIQRDRDFAHYQDLESRYHRRPSLWVQPLGDWGRGRVELVEIPSPQETNDNVVSYWVADRPTLAGESSEHRFLLNAYLEHPARPPGGRVEATRVGSATRPGSGNVEPQRARLFVIDFNRGDLPMLAAGQPVEAVVNASSGRLGPAVTQKNPDTGGWRVFFDFFPDGDQAADLRCYLKMYRFVLTETWNYLWTP